MILQEFWQTEKKSFLLACIALLFFGSIIIIMKGAKISENFQYILLTFPLCFLMAFGIYKFTNKK